MSLTWVPGHATEALEAFRSPMNAFKCLETIGKGMNMSYDAPRRRLGNDESTLSFPSISWASDDDESITKLDFAGSLKFPTHSIRSMASDICGHQMPSSSHSFLTNCQDDSWSRSRSMVRSRNFSSSLSLLDQDEDYKKPCPRASAA
ncbi:hypothetical protein MPSEU_000435800 [Mayamaea pseudoterrestris]|nr:hypothetical protein MPSEU_000435800 [Mayamaea pseudoterrestris]